MREGGAVRYIREVCDAGQRGGAQRQGARQRPHRGGGRSLARRQVQPEGRRRAQAERQCCHSGARKVLLRLLVIFNLDAKKRPFFSVTCLCVSLFGIVARVDETI